MTVNNEKFIYGRNVKAELIEVSPDPLKSLNIAKGYRIGDVIVTSGQVPLNEQGKIVGKGEFKKQVEQVYKNIQTILEEAGSNLNQVIKMTCYLSDIKNMSQLIEVRNEYFSAPFPADTIVEVSSLAHPDFLIEIEAISLINV